MIFYYKKSKTKANLKQYSTERNETKSSSISLTASIFSIFSAQNLHEKFFAMLQTKDIYSNVLYASREQEEVILDIYLCEELHHSPVIQYIFINNKIDTGLYSVMFEDVWKKMWQNVSV